MSVFTSIVARRAAALALSFAISTAVPFLLKDKPVLKWVAGKTLPVIVDRVNDRLAPDKEPGDAK